MNQGFNRSIVSPVATDVFMHLGLPMEPLFMQRVHEKVFGEGTEIPEA